MPESVLVVKREHIESFIAGKNGLIPFEPQILDIIDRVHQFIPRPDAENDPSYKQIIPYIMLTQGSRCFVTKRLAGGGEARLHGLMSLGVGGHINPSDQSGGEGSALENGLLRELREEVELENQPGGFRYSAFINDDSNPVGSVHLGLFVRAEVRGSVLIRETEKLSGEFVEQAKLCKLKDSMETWSQLILDAGV